MLFMAIIMLYKMGLRKAVVVILTQALASLSKT